MIFCAAIRCVFKGKKRLETISQILLRQGKIGHRTRRRRALYAGAGRKDDQRTNELRAMNLTVVRICNLDIDRNFCGVCEYVDRLVQNSLPQSASLTAPSSEGALDAATSKQ